MGCFLGWVEMNDQRGEEEGAACWNDKVVVVVVVWMIALHKISILLPFLDVVTIILHGFESPPFFQKTVLIFLTQIATHYV